MDQARLELNYLLDFFTAASDSYKQYKELHLVRNEMEEAFNRKDLAFSEVERAQRRFLWKLEGLVEKASNRMPKMPLIFIHKEGIDHNQRLVSILRTGLGVVERDDELITELAKRGF